MPESLVVPATWAFGIFITSGISFVGLAVTLGSYAAKSSARSAENSVTLSHIQGQLSVITPLVPKVEVLQSRTDGLDARLASHSIQLDALHRGQADHGVAIATIRGKT